MDSKKDRNGMNLTEAEDIKRWQEYTESEKGKWKLLSCVRLSVTPWTVVHGILQARILEWVAFPFSRGSSQLREPTQVSCIAGGFYTTELTWEAEEVYKKKS